MVYLDDILIYSKNEQIHAQHLRQVLQKLREHRLFGKLQKCEFFVTSLEFLGHKVSAQGIAVLERKVQALREWPTPKDKTQTRSFLGLANYYRRFVPAFSAIARPLTDLTRKNVAFKWDAECEAAFELLKQKLCSAPVLALPDPNYPFVVVTDASDIAIGGALMQDFGSGLQPIAYESRKLKGAELNYSAYDREMLGILHALRVWRHYLSGVHFEVHTDHNTLRHITTQPSLSQRQARWVEFISEFDFEIKYLKGKENVVADALSRIPLSTPDADTVQQLNHISCVDLTSQFLSQLKAAAKSDGEYQRLVHHTEKHFKTVGGLLYRSVGGQLRLVVPQSKTLRSQILQECHDIPIAGHLGQDKTYHSLCRWFYWPGMYTDAVAYVKACPYCQVNKSSTKAPIGLAQPMPIPEAPWQQMSLDLVSSLPTTSTGFDTAVVFVDKFSKMVHIAPTVIGCTGADVARLYLEYVFKHHGLVESIVSDRDPRFTGAVWRTLHNLLGTTLKMSTAHHPQTDGQSERAIRTLTEMLRSYVVTNEATWDQYLPLVEFAYNNSINPSTGFTPFYLVYGREVASPIARMSEALDSQPASMPVADMLTQWRGALKQARQRLLKAQARQTAATNKHRREGTFAVGDRVLLNTAHLALKAPRKLKPRWLGPYTVLAQTSPVNYKLLLPLELGSMHNVFHSSVLKPWNDDGRQPVARPGPVIVEGQTEYEIEAILADKLLDSRHPKKGRQYLVKWAGYPLADATWEPECNLQEDVPHLLQAYHQDRLPKKEDSPMKARGSKPLRRSERLKAKEDNP